MAIRFLDTNFFKSPFVRSLKGNLKSLYIFITLDCPGSGIWPADFEAASLYTGNKITEQEFLDAFVSTGKAICLDNGRYFFPDFIEHQYPKGLKDTNPAHVNFISELNKYGVLDEALKPLKRPFEGSYVTATVKAKVKVKETVKGVQGEIYRKFKHLFLTIEDFDKLVREGWDQSQIDEILDKIENYKNNKNYTSLLITARNWLRKDQKPNSVQRKISASQTVKNLYNEPATNTGAN